MSYSSSRQAGFTIIELLVVIVVIGILAAITIVAFNGVQQKAHAAVIASDINSATKQLAVDNAVKGVFPSSLDSANNGAGLVATDGTTYQYTYNATDNSYCLTATNGSMAYKIASSDAVATEGVCPGHTAPGDGGSVPPPVNTGVVTVFAGSTRGSANGTGTSAQFYAPAGVAVDSSGTVYVADTWNNVVRKISPSGVVTTLAGSGTAGSANGTGTSAQLYNPYDLVVDSSGTVFVADLGNSRIRKITSGGVVTTFAGSSQGYTNGTGTGAKFANPGGIAIDESGTLYVSDQNNNVIRKITSAGVVTTLAGSGVAGTADGTGTSAQFNKPFGIDVDSSGTVYVADMANGRIRKITSAGVVTTLAGSTQGFADGTGTSAQFNAPYGLAIDSTGVIYIGDTVNNRIRKITSAGVVTTLAGSTKGSADGTGTSAQFYSPYGLAIDPTSGVIYEADYGNHRIRKIQ